MENEDYFIKKFLSITKIIMNDEGYDSLKTLGDIQQITNKLDVSKLDRILKLYEQMLMGVFNGWQDFFGKTGVMIDIDTISKKSGPTSIYIWSNFDKFEKGMENMFEFFKKNNIQQSSLSKSEIFSSKYFDGKKDEMFEKIYELAKNRFQTARNRFDKKNKSDKKNDKKKEFEFIKYHIFFNSKRLGKIKKLTLLSDETVIDKNIEAVKENIDNLRKAVEKDSKNMEAIKEHLDNSKNINDNINQLKEYSDDEYGSDESNNSLF